MTKIRGANYTDFHSGCHIYVAVEPCNMGYTVTARVHNNKDSLGGTVACIYTSTTAQVWKVVPLIKTI